jgi:hypothetical protein
MSTEPFTAAQVSSVGVSRALAATRRRRAIAMIATAAAGSAVLVWLLSHTYAGLHAGSADQRVANPTPPHALPHLTWLGASVDSVWIPVFWVVMIAVNVWMITVFVRHWTRSRSLHPAVPVFAVYLLQFLMDPLYNWSIYCNYYPGLSHWPINWPIFNVAPTVEPTFVLFGAYTAFYVGPAMLVFWLYQRVIQRHAKNGSWLQRHQLLSLFLFASVLGAGIDILMEQWMLNMYIYKYTQIAGPSLTLGHGHLQIAEIIWTGLLIATVTMLLHRDDKGWSMTRRLSRARPFRTLRLGEWGVALVVVTGAMGLYGIFWAGLRLDNQATHVAPGGWPYPAAKTYDPNGRMKAAGMPGPYFTGTWCTGTHCRS